MSPGRPRKPRRPSAQITAPAAAHEHPKLGRMRAGDLLAAWAAHDSLHLRQIAKRLYQMTRRDAGDHEVAYGGNWTA